MLLYKMSSLSHEEVRDTDDIFKFAALMGQKDNQYETRILDDKIQLHR